tara:strand:- start:35778 stop:36386 length:609 start_codon:yes stop_codon:yes gene_type:complete
MQSLLIATSNQGKYNEIMQMLLPLPIKLYSLKDKNIDMSDFVENGETYQDNSRMKAQYAAIQAQMMTLADDSGIVVNALEGELGVKTRRWGAGEHASDQEWVDYFLNRMKDEKDRSAKFICSAYLVEANGSVLYDAMGETEGVLANKLMAPIKSGIPLSSLFVPNGFDFCYAALSEHQKNMISHRGKAMAKVREYLSNKVQP